MASNIETEKALENIKTSMGYEPTTREVRNTINIQKVSNNVSTFPKKYSYVPKLTAIFTDGEVYDLLNYTTIILVENNLDDYVFPLFHVRLDIPITYVPKFQADDNLQIRFELMYNDTTALDTAQMYDILWDILLKKVKQDNSPIIAEQLVYEENHQYIRTAPFEMKLIPIECLKANKTLFSGAYSNCDVSQLLTLITEKLEYKTFIYQPDNIKKYDQIIFPPYNLFYSIEYLDNYFGIYDRGLKMFYGFGQSYIMPRNYNMETGLNKVKVTFSRDVEAGIDFESYTGGGIARVGNDNYITITPDKVKILDRKHYIQETFGTIISTYSRDDDSYFEQERQYDYADNSDSDVEKVKTFVNRYNNTNKEKEHFLQAAYTKQIELNLNDAVLDPESWFKPFKMEFDSDNYPQLEGTYSLKGYFCRFDRLNNSNGASEYNVSTVIELIEV